MVVPVMVSLRSVAPLAMPKSISLTTPSGVSIMLAGLISRWTTPWRCAYPSAASTWLM